LLDLPPDLLRSIESSKDTPLTWVIKGDPAEEAVLCTNDKTYSIRSVSLSNSVLVVGPGEPEDQIVIRDTIHELLQFTLVLPKVHKLVGLLRGREYDEGREDLDDDALVGEQDSQNQQQVRPHVQLHWHAFNVQRFFSKGEKGVSYLRASPDRDPGK
jgi:sister chromatid cohesion protein DCC1